MNTQKLFEYFADKDLVLLEDDMNNIAGIVLDSVQLYGVYNENDNLISVHQTEEGAEENKRKLYGGDFIRYDDGEYYVDFVTLHL